MQEDSSDVSKFKEIEVELQIGNEISKFATRTDMLTDSLGYATQGMDIASAAQLILPHVVGRSSSFMFRNMTVYKNYPRVGVFTQIFAPSSEIKVMAEGPLEMRWTLVEGDTTILDLRCNKATLTFAGRRYTAWYTPEIPISEGPYKFNGLPGLIVEVGDSQRQHVFTLTGITNYQKPNPIIYSFDERTVSIAPENITKAVQQSIFNSARKIIDDPTGTYSSISNESKAKSSKYISHKNNFIEKY